MKNNPKIAIMFHIALVAALFTTIVCACARIAKAEENAIHTPQIYTEYNLKAEQHYTILSAEKFTEIDGKSFFVDAAGHVWITNDAYPVNNGTMFALLMEMTEPDDIATWKICGVWIEAEAVNPENMRLY